MVGLNEYELAVALGIILSVLFVFAVIFERVWFKLYGFIDDSKEAEHSKIIRFLCLRKGYKDRRSEVYWFSIPSGGISDGTWPFIQFALSLLIGPIAVLMAFKLYALSMFIISSIAVLFLARFAFRAKKVMSKHINNKEIHKS